MLSIWNYLVPNLVQPSAFSASATHGSRLSDPLLPWPDPHALNSTHEEPGERSFIQPWIDFARPGPYDRRRIKILQPSEQPGNTWCDLFILWQHFNSCKDDKASTQSFRSRCLIHLLRKSVSNCGFGRRIGMQRFTDRANGVLDVSVEGTQIDASLVDKKAL